MKKFPTNLLRQYGLITVAAIAYAVVFNWFFVSNQIPFGGVTGLSQVIYTLFGAPPVGVMIIAVNIPLFALGLRFLGWRVLVSSLYAMTVSSVFIDLTAAYVVFPSTDPLLSALCGGAALGITLGIIFSQSATTGGTDLMARLIKLRLSWVPMGRVVMIIDLMVVLVSAAVFGEINSALYGIVALVLCGKSIDVVLYGLDNTRVAYIISSAPDKITAAIMTDMDRGVTILNGTGGWSREHKDVLFVAFRQREIVTVRRIVKEVDPRAFLIVCPAHEVLGEGFRDHSEDRL